MSKNKVIICPTVFFILDGHYRIFFTLFDIKYICDIIIIIKREKNKTLYS